MGVCETPTSSVFPAAAPAISAATSVATVHPQMCSNGFTWGNDRVVSGLNDGSGSVDEAHFAAHNPCSMVVDEACRARLIEYAPKILIDAGATDEFYLYQ